MFTHGILEALKALFEHFSDKRKAKKKLKLDQLLNNCWASKEYK